jgi:membrane-associated phospholipid phosphatase
LDILVTTAQLFFLVTAQILGSLLLFSTIIAVLVFTVRKPMRKYKPIDLAIFEKIRGLTNHRTNQFMLFITFLGKHQFLVPANLLLIFYFLLMTRQTWFSVRVVAIALSSLVLMLVLKRLFKRKRPLSPLLKAARGLSFPSGHAIMAVSFYGLIIYCILHSGWEVNTEILMTTLLVLLILLIGFSRIYLRVHYSSDVIAGFIIGFIWLMISLFVIGKAEQLSVQVADETALEVSSKEMQRSPLCLSQQPVVFHIISPRSGFLFSTVNSLTRRLTYISNSATLTLSS